MAEKKVTKEKEKKINPSAVESLTGEDPKEKEVKPIDTETPAEEVLKFEEEESTDELTDEFLGIVFNKDKLNMTTDITRKGAVVMSRAKMLSNIFSCKELDDFADFIKEHLVSNKRLGRKELIEAYSASRSDMGFGGEPEPELKEKIWGK